MHEVGIMQSVISMAEERARSSGASQIHELRLRVGRLSGVMPFALEGAFEALSEGTLAAGARLTLEEVPAACWCADCSAEFECPDLVWECPRCRKASAQLRRGRELELVSMEIS